MIRDRNIAKDAAISIAKLQGGGAPLLGGDVFWVAKSGANLYSWLGQRVEGDNLHTTIDSAINSATANRGDVILVAPGHTESVSAAAGIDFDKAGLTCIGLGHGADRPTITFDTAITADMDIAAASTYIENLLFVNGVDNLTAPLHITAADATLIDIETRDNNSSYHCDDFILTSAAADRLQILDWVHNAQGGKTGGQTAISLIGTDDTIIVPKWIWGDFATACIENVTTAAKNLQIFGRASYPAYLQTVNTADVIVTCVATTTGRQGPFLNARLKQNTTNITEAFVGADMEFFQPINIVNLDGESSMQTNITASTDA